MTTNSPDQDDYDPTLDEAGDDFAYEEESFEDDTVAEEESWDEGYEEGTDESLDEKAQKPQKKNKKKGGVFNVVLILAAVLGGGGFIYLKLLSPPVGAPSATPAPVTAEAPVIAEEPIEQAQISSEPSPEMPAPDLVADPLTPALDGSPQPNLVDNTIPGEVLAAPQPPVEVSDTPPMPAPIGVPPPVTTAQNGFVAGLPSARDIMITPPAPADGVVQADNSLAPAALSGDLAKSLEQKLSVLIMRLDTFEGRVASLETGLHQMSTQMATSLPASAPTADLASIQDSLQMLEKKLSALEKADPKVSEPDVVAEVAQKSPPSEQPVFVPASESMEEPESSAVNKAQEDFSGSGVASLQKVSIKKEAPPAPEIQNNAWVLRSAQPGSAMVASSSGGDIRTISVGDTLAGLGKITSIEMKNSRWVVQGTRGLLTH